MAAVRAAVVLLTSTRRHCLIAQPHLYHQNVLEYNNKEFSFFRTVMKNIYKYTIIYLKVRVLCVIFKRFNHLNIHNICMYVLGIFILWNLLKIRHKIIFYV